MGGGGELVRGCYGCAFGYCSQALVWAQLARWPCVGRCDAGRDTEQQHGICDLWRHGKPARVRAPEQQLRADVAAVQQPVQLAHHACHVALR